MTLLPSLCALLALAPALLAQTSKNEPRELLPAPFDRYFERRVQELSSADWQNDITPETWPATQAAMRVQLRGMLGLDPWPARGPLQPVITGTVEGDGYVIEKLHFQSLPGLYVTANLYRPKVVEQPLPAILYVCGHSNVVENGVSLGNKTGYQHHGIWFARHGYVCLIIDTIGLGEIRGEHHGTYRHERWWWASRGYTPAGVEAWNGMRALDYLEARPEVDRAKIGLTGRSGGGAYSWWIAALDDRIAAVVPVAGITTLRNHVIDGAIEGHCDCMFMVNTARWDFDRVAALVAPRPLLISNTDADSIFPLDGVLHIHERTRALYRRLGHEDRLGLHIAEGPHADTQPLNVGAFAWLNRFLKGADRLALIDEPAKKSHPPRELKVFAELPRDERVTTVDEWFVPAFESKSEPGPLEALRRDCFRAWPANAAAVIARKKSDSVGDGLRLTEWEFTSEEPFALTLWVVQVADKAPQNIEGIQFAALDDETWKSFQSLAATVFPKRFPEVKPAPEFASEKLLTDPTHALAFVCPRGVGPTSWAALSPAKQTHLRRRLLLLGESLESGQVWDIIQAVAALRSVPGFARTPLVLSGSGTMGANTLYASLFLPKTSRLKLTDLPASHRTGPTYLNVLRHLDLPQAQALAAEHAPR